MSQRVWVWVGHMGLTDRIQQVLQDYGDRITDVSIFGWSVDRDGGLTQTFNPTQLDAYRDRWPHLRFWGAFRNMDDPDDGPRVIFDALRDSASARSRLAGDVGAVFDQYPWLHGVDIDLESGGDERSEDSEAIFQAVADQAHALGRQCAAALPPLTSTGSVGGENWVRYAELGRIVDVVEIMSYDFSWSGSAPGPISPGFWMEDVYDWAASQIDPSRIFMGVPLYAYYWRLHDYPPNLGNPWRGLSGTYYSFWQQFTGYAPWYDDGSQPQAGWLAYRDPDGQSLWGLLHAYDWLQPDMHDASTGLTTDIFQGSRYAVRYGQPSGDPLWSVVDNTPGSSSADYTLTPRAVVDVDGDEAGPRDGFTLTLETFPRDAIAATIIDDYITGGDIYDNRGGWDDVEEREGYTVLKGSGVLEYDHDLQADFSGIYAQARGQFAQDGTFSVYAYGWTAEYRNTDGRLRLLRAGTVAESTYVRARAATTTPQASQIVLGLRVRESSARVHFGISEEGRLPNVLESLSSSTPGGPVGYDSTARMHLDHLYLGDGWWYQPREAVEVTVGGESWTAGRISREGVSWSGGMFKPDDDVDEWDTHAPDQWQEYSLQDWGFEHWVGAPFALDSERSVQIVPVDHDAWLGRVFLFDRAGGFIAYCNDAQAVAHWRGRAEHDWNLAGVAMWSLGQEDVRLWDTIGGGELAAETKILDG